MKLVCDAWEVWMGSEVSMVRVLLTAVRGERGTDEEGICGRREDAEEHATDRYG